MGRLLLWRGSFSTRILASRAVSCWSFRLPRGRALLEAWRWLAGWCAILVAVGGAGASAGTPDCSQGRVFVDGLPLEAGRGVKYMGVDVTIAPDGSIHISTGPGTVRQEPAATLPAAASPVPANTVEGEADPRIVEPRGETRPGVKGRYWVVVQDRGGGNPGWTVAVRLNGRDVGTFVSGQPKVIEVTSMLHDGENTAELEFQAPAGAAGVSGSGIFQVLLAPGKVAEGDEAITLGYPVISQERAGGSDTGGVVVRFELPPPILP